MTELTLSSELTIVLETEAERSGITIAALAEEWLRQHYALLRREQLAAQTKRFQSKQTELYAQYPDQYVAFYDDQVLDHGDDLRQLALRVKAKHGLLPVVIAQVTASPVSGYRIRSPRLQQANS
ncbi:MAG: DUF5678 domain-containing protein [Caldilineaceae bacterium]|jgi:hypothetical protein